jgi:hypothetical protein
VEIYQRPPLLSTRNACTLAHASPHANLPSSFFFLSFSKAAERRLRAANASLEAEVARRSGSGLAAWSLEAVERAEEDLKATLAAVTAVKKTPYWHSKKSKKKAEQRKRKHIRLG